MKKRILAIVIAAMCLTGCGQVDQPAKRESSTSVDIYVSDDVDVFGNKIDGDVIAIGTKTGKEEVVSSETIIENEEVDYKGLEVYFIDVGQADCILIRIDNDEDILIDGGNNGDGKDIVDYLKFLGVEEISAMIATHPHEDHIGGLDIVMSEIPTEKVYTPYVDDKDIPTTVTYKDFLNAIEDCEAIAIEPQNGDIIYQSNSCILQVISPNEVNPGDLNDYSIVTKLTYGETEFIFTGDASTEINEFIMNNYDEDFVDIDILKVGHHGSRTSTNDDWIKATTPECAIIMCEAGNSYGHPHKECINSLGDITTYRTDIDGTIKITCDGKSYLVETKLTGDVPLGNKKFDIKNVS